MKRKIIAFDLDGTLAPSKSPAPDKIVELLDQLLDKYHVCVISGGKFEQFEKQLLCNLKVAPEKLEKLHIMPTCGTRYYHFDITKKNWQKVYAEDFTEKEKKKIIRVLEQVTESLGFREKETYGETIEDRGSQIAFSALGQDIIDVLGKEGIRRKEEWDPNNAKKKKIRDKAAELLLEFEVRIGGLTTIDVTPLGIDKAYGMKKLMELLGISKEEIFFIGDRLAKGGNDYPVKAMGIDCMEISHWQETTLVVEAIINIS